MGEIGILEGVGAGDRLMIGFRYRAIENGTTVDAFVDVITNAYSSASLSWSSHHPFCLFYMFLGKPGALDARTRR